jgi:hypothetical protein
MSSAYNNDVQAIWAALSDMQSNLSYMRGELPRLTLPATPGTELVSVLDEFDSLLYDLRSEARNLEDKLGMHPGKAPNDPGIVNPDPRVTLGFLRGWPQDNFQALHALVQGLEAAHRQDPAAGLAFVLVAESATHMLNANQAMLESIERIEARLK